MASKNIQPYVFKPQRTALMKTTGLPDVREPLDHKGLAILLKRGFTIKELAETFNISRPTLHKLLDSKDNFLHPGMTEYVNTRINFLLASTAV